MSKTIYSIYDEALDNTIADFTSLEEAQNLLHDLRVDGMCGLRIVSYEE